MFGQPQIRMFFVLSALLAPKGGRNVFSYALRFWLLLVGWGVLR